MSPAGASVQLFDTHCHFDFSFFDGRREEVLGDCLRVGIHRLVVPSVQRTAWPAVASLAATALPHIDVAFGLHPYFIEAHQKCDLDDLDDRLNEDGCCVAVGEIGLDAKKPLIQKQEELFCRQLELARHHDLPVIVHSFRTHSRVYKLIKESGVRKGVIHAFSGSLQDAARFIELGLHLGIGPVITWEGSRKTRNTVSQLPIEALVIETDAPDMPVSGMPKGSGSPLNLVSVYEAMCAIRSEQPELIARQLWENSCNLFDVE